MYVCGAPIHLLTPPTCRSPRDEPRRSLSQRPRVSAPRRYDLRRDCGQEVYTNRSPRRSNARHAEIREPPCSPLVGGAGAPAMSRHKVHVTIFCPYMGPDDDDYCGAPIHLVIDPPERRTWEYPGSPAAVPCTAMGKASSLMRW